MAVTSKDERLWNTVHVISADWFEHIYFRKQYSWLLQYCYINVGLERKQYSLFGSSPNIVIYINIVGLERRRLS